MDTVTIYLTTPEAVLFREYQKNKHIFDIMYKEGVFDLQFGKCTLNFAYGELQNIVKENMIYRK
jgi:hypothetical protein